MVDITFPVMKVKMVPIKKVIANEYNPNKVASKEMELLKISILEDGVTQPLVTFYHQELDLYEIVDGFHRHSVLTELGCAEVPVVVIDKPIRERMASTIRHNRARGKHQVELQADLVKSLIQKGWSDEHVAHHLGMTEEEVVRLKQIVGIARMFAGSEYTKSWGRVKDEY